MLRLLIIDYYSGKQFNNVEVVDSVEDMPRDTVCIANVLDKNTMERYYIYFGTTDNFFYAIKDEE